MVSRLQSPGFQRYLAWLKTVKCSGYSAFNELNHFQTVQQLRDVKKFNKTFSKPQLVSLWKDMMGAEPVDDIRVVLNSGVRQSLSALFGLYRDKNWAIPSNIYPVYSMLAKEAKVEHLEEYNYFDKVKLYDRLFDSSLHSHSRDNQKAVDILLITDPSPFGQDLTAYDISRLKDWVSDPLDTEGHRRIVIDSVYAAKFRVDMMPLIQSDRVYYLHSLSKYHALPIHLGFVITPSTEIVAQNTIEDMPDEGKLNTASYCLSTYRSMMKEQQDIFQSEWDNVLSTELQELNRLGKMKPVRSYLNISAVAVSTAMESNILTIPSTIYSTGDSSICDKCEDNTLSTFSYGDSPPSLYTESTALFSILSRCIPERLESKLPFTRTMYHVTRCSNFARGFDKYSRTYSKALIGQSTFPSEFYLLYLQELYIGINKTLGSIGKALSYDSNSITKDYPVVIETKTKNILHPSPSGVAQYIEGDSVLVERIGIVTNLRTSADSCAVSLTEEDDIDVQWLTVEEMYAKSMKLNDSSLTPFSQCTPRSISILPVAQGCQAKCSFCFSHSSISSDLNKRNLSMDRITSILDHAQSAGAERAVITGGGEPMVTPFPKICMMIEECASRFSAVIMITNGYALSKLRDAERLQALLTLRRKGLTVLSISRHGVTEENNTAIMKLSTQADRIASTYSTFINSISASDCDRKTEESVSLLKGLRLRWVCVLQKGGVDSDERLRQYLDWVASTGVSEVCFKELYVSSSEESLYHHQESNQYSRTHQVSLRLLTQFLEDNGATIASTLPWGSPVYDLHWPSADGVKHLKIAAYTEPTVYWERQNKLCRSWNLMSDGDCFSSLETKESLVDL